MKTPEKIYLYPYPTDGIYEVETKPLEGTVEYIRKDAFIEKALKFIKTNVDRIVNNQHGVRIGCMDGEFRNYMEGE